LAAKRKASLLVLVSKELLNDGRNVTLVMLKEVTVEINVQEAHAIERLELSGERLILLSNRDRNGSRGGSGSGSSRGGSRVLNGDNVNPNAVAECLTRGTMHTPVRNVTSRLLGSLHLYADSYSRSGRNLAGNLNILNRAELLASVAL